MTQCLSWLIPRCLQLRAWAGAYTARTRLRRRWRSLHGQMAGLHRGRRRRTQAREWSEQARCAHEHLFWWLCASWLFLLGLQADNKLCSPVEGGLRVGSATAPRGPPPHGARGTRHDGSTARGSPSPTFGFSQGSRGWNLGNPFDPTCFLLLLSLPGLWGRGRLQS
jgi:hypothetical protein